MALNAQQRRFAEEYLIDLNATQAAVRAGYSEKTAYSKGHQLLKIVEVGTLIQELKDARSQRTEITADRVLQELAAIGFANARDAVDWGVKEVAFGFDDEGRRLPADKIGDATVVHYVQAPFVEPINARDLPPEIARAVSEVKLSTNGFGLKMHDKLGALNKLGDHLGMWKQKLEVGGPDGAPLLDELAAAARLAAILEAARGRRDGGE